METKKFNELLKTMDYKKIIAKYMHNNIYLTDKQLGKVIDLKNKKERERWKK